MGAYILSGYINGSEVWEEEFTNATDAEKAGARLAEEGEFTTWNVSGVGRDDDDANRD